MKVIFYSKSLSRSAGGLYYSVSGLAKGLAQCGADMTVVGGADEHFEEDRHIWGDIPLVCHPLKHNGYGLDSTMLRYFSDAKPDILHIQGIWTASSVYGSMAARRNVPTVVSPRGMLDPWILKRSPIKKFVHAKLFERPMLHRGFVHALNDSEYQSTSAYMPELRERTFVVPNGIPPACANFPAEGRSGFLYISRLHEKKQVIELIEAWGKHAPANETLTIAGWGDAAYEQRVRELSEKTPRVKFVGSAYGEVKQQLLAHARWYILPSLSEGLPMAALEALQHGCIPVLTNECNLGELFDHGAAIKMRTDFSDFPQVMAQLSAMPEDERNALSVRCAAEAVNYLWDSIAKRMLSQYVSIVHGRVAEA